MGPVLLSQLKESPWKGCTLYTIIATLLFTDEYNDELRRVISLQYPRTSLRKSGSIAKKINLGTHFLGDIDMMYLVRS